MRFRDIPQFTRGASYKVHVGWDYLPDWLEDHMTVSSGAQLDLDPDFQRAHVWSKAKQRAYVEFILRGGQSSRDILFNCVGWMGNFEGPFVLVDGKQRLEAARRFLRNDLDVFDGYKFKDFTDRMTHDAHFYVHVNDLKTRAEVLQWYLDLNTGGVVHTKAELDKVRALLEEENAA